MKFKLLDVLVCPLCKKKVEKKGMFIICKKCKLAYPIISGIPDMLPEDAWDLNKAKEAEFKHSLKL